MNQKSFSRTITLKIPTSIALIVGLLFLAGCESTIQPTLNTEVSPLYAGATIEVDLVGINTSEYQIWKAKSVNDYFTSDDQFRDAAVKKTLYFGEQKKSSQTFSSSDPIWTQWVAKECAFVVVIADLPGYVKDEQVDRRRQLIPLDLKLWSGTPSDITITVSPTGIQLLPSPEAVDF